jgi:nucleotide-binding universal stress UspA family protein
MGYRSIAVHLDATERCAERVAIAARMAAAYQARLIGIAPVGVVEIVSPFAPTGAEIVLADWMAALRAEAERAAARFREVVRDSALRDAEALVVEDDVQTALTYHGRQSDLLILGQADPADRHRPSRRRLPDRLALTLGRPVLVVPHAGHFAGVGRRPVIAWQDTREAARAVADALPILKRAEAVKLVSFESTRPVQEATQPVGREAESFLRSHGIEAHAVNDRTDIDFGAALLSLACDWDADLIVMGGYGHSAVREWVLGGVTQTVLDSMTVPVLLSH